MPLFNIEYTYELDPVIELDTVEVEAEDEDEAEDIATDLITTNLLSIPEATGYFEIGLITEQTKEQK